MAANYIAQLPQGERKTEQDIQRGIRIYTGAFRKLPVESLHVEAYDPSI